MSRHQAVGRVRRAGISLCLFVGDFGHHQGASREFNFDSRAGDRLVIGGDDPNRRLRRFRQVELNALGGNSGSGVKRQERQTAVRAASDKTQPLAKTGEELIPAAGNFYLKATGGV